MRKKIKDPPTFTELLFQECFLSDKTLDFSGGDKLPEIFIYEKKDKTKTKRIHSIGGTKSKAEKESRS